LRLGDDVGDRQRIGAKREAHQEIDVVTQDQLGRELLGARRVDAAFVAKDNLDLVAVLLGAVQFLINPDAAFGLRARRPVRPGEAYAPPYLDGFRRSPASPSDGESGDASSDAALHSVLP